MWWDTGSNPNAETTETLDSLSHLTAEHKDTCHLDYYHVDTPAPAELSECAPYKDNACCAAATVTNATKIKESYGSKYHWDRCGPLSPQCERYFVEEACFYECEPAGSFLFSRLQTIIDFPSKKLGGDHLLRMLCTRCQTVGSFSFSLAQRRSHVLSSCLFL